MIIDNSYKYKDGRIVKLVQFSNKRNRAEVIIGKFNPFWVNANDLTIIKQPIKFKNFKKLSKEELIEMRCNAYKYIM